MTQTKESRGRTVIRALNYITTASDWEEKWRNKILIFVLQNYFGGRNKNEPKKEKTNK
jgi:hypothetical protein